MAILEEMTETKGQSSPRRPTSMLQDSNVSFSSPPLGQARILDNGRVTDVDIASCLSDNSKFKINRHNKNQYATPIATPATVSETPISEDSSAGSDFHRSRSPSPNFQSKPMTTFSSYSLTYGISVHSPMSPKDISKAVSSQDSQNSLRDSTTNSSPQQQGRTLFREFSSDVISSGNNVVLSQRRAPKEQPRISRSPCLGIPASPAHIHDNKNDQFRSPRTEMDSSSSRAHRLRSRRYHSIEEESSPSKPLRSERRRNSRRRSSSSRNYFSDTNNSTFSLSVVSIEDEVSVSSNDDSNMDLSSNSYRRRKEVNKACAKQRTKVVSFPVRAELIGSAYDHNAEFLMGWRLKNFRFKTLATTKTMVWLLCLVGIISVSMIVLTNHRITKSFDSNEHKYEDHVTVLFRRNGSRSNVDSRSNDSISSAKWKIVPRRDEESLHSAISPLRLGNLNLNKLSHFQDHSLKDNDTSNGVKEHSNVKPKEKGKENKKPEDRTQKQTSRDDHSAGIKMGKELHPQGKSREDTHRHKHQVDNHSHHHHRHTSNKKTNLRQNEDARAMRVATDGRITTPVGWTPFGSRDSTIDRCLYKGILPTLSGGSTSNRIIMLGSFEDIRYHSRKLELYPSPFTDNTQVYPILDSRDDEDERIKTMEIRRPYSEGECVPMADWQTTFNPSCNGMHELDLVATELKDTEEDFTLFGKNGFWRNAWKYEKVQIGHVETVVLKTLKINHRFEDAHYEHNRIDAVVLERLTASPHVIDIFGFCGHSVLTEYADGKRLGDLADKNKKVPLARLKIAIDIASGLADVHSIDGEKHASFVHLDINPANVVSIGGTLKLNDFNIGILRRWNTTSDAPCGIPAQYPNPQWRSPEEARAANDLTEKVDVFSMGHIFFRLICGHEPWNKFEVGGMPPKAELNEKVRNGELPRIPDDVTQSKDPEVVAIREAMLQCYKYDPLERPSARSIVNKLRSTLVVLQSNMKNQ